MKKSLLYISALLLGMGALASCSNDEVLPPVPTPEGGFETLGDGSWESPYSAYQCLVGSPGEEANDVWVTGYIVGWLNTDASPTFSLEEKSARIGEAAIPCSAESNLLLSVNNPAHPVLDENGEPVLNEDGTPKVEMVWPDWTECCTVQLPSGAVRSALSLMQHPDNLGKQVAIKGTTGIKYCGVYGLKNSSNFQWGDKGVYEEPKEPIVNATFTKVNDFEGDGQYLMVFNGNIMALSVENTSGHGYIQVKEVNIDGDSYTTSTENAYTFKQTENGYTIRDGRGCYIWKTTAFSNTQFQITAAEGTEGMDWSVTRNSDGTFTIMNILTKTSMQYSSSYSNVASYSGVNGVFPMLYKRVTE